LRLSIRTDSFEAAFGTGSAGVEAAEGGVDTAAGAVEGRTSPSMTANRGADRPGCDGNRDCGVDIVSAALSPASALLEDNDRDGLPALEAPNINSLDVPMRVPSASAFCSAFIAPVANMFSILDIAGLPCNGSLYLKVKMPCSSWVSMSWMPLRSMSLTSQPSGFSSSCASCSRPYMLKHTTRDAGMTTAPRRFTYAYGNAYTNTNTSVASRWQYTNGVGQVTMRTSASHDCQSQQPTMMQENNVGEMS
jgi:hypothetical protein